MSDRVIYLVFREAPVGQRDSDYAVAACSSRALAEQERQRVIDEVFRERNPHWRQTRESFGDAVWIEEIPFMEEVRGE